MLKELSPFRTPPVIWAGPHTATRIPAEVRRLGGTHVLVVTDRGLLAAGTPQKLEETLLEAGLGATTYSEVPPEPSVDSVAAVVELARECQADLILGVGGGSSLDVAKATALLVTNGGTAEAYFGVERASKPALPVIAVPTTAGTGSEATPNAIFADPKEKSKKGIVSGFIMPQVAIVDPLLTLTLPAPLTAATGMDALIHAIESFTSLRATPLTDLFAAEAIRLIGTSLRKAVFQGSDLDARSNMALGSLYAGIAIANAGTGAVHAMSYPLGAEFHVSHGVATASLLTHVLRWNFQGNVPKFARVARLLGEEVDGLSDLQAAERAVASVERLVQDLSIPTTLRSFGVEAGHLPAMAEAAHANRRLMNNNPRALSAAEIKKIYAEAL